MRTKQPRLSPPLDSPSKTYRPKTPRNVACWAVIQAFGTTRQKAVDALIAAGIRDEREWQNGVSLRQQAENHVSYLERNGWYKAPG